jgi:hypothetical protein
MNGSSAVEMVMPVGSTISGPSATGRVAVTAVARYSRKYVWEGNTETYQLEPRNRRWNGEYGIGLNPATPRDGRANSDWRVRRVQEVLAQLVPAEIERFDEYQLHYHSVAAVVRDLASINGGGSQSKVYWTSDGLAVGFDVQGGILGSTVTQYCVDGEKPRNLPGATTAVRITGADGKPTSTLPCAHVDESAYYDTWEAKQDGH